MRGKAPGTHLKTRVNQNYTCQSSRNGPGDRERSRITRAKTRGTDRGPKREPKLHEENLQEQTGEGYPVEVMRRVVPQGGRVGGGETGGGGCLARSSPRGPEGLKKPRHQRTRTHRKQETKNPGNQETLNPRTARNQETRKPRNQENRKPRN